MIDSAEVPMRNSAHAYAKVHTHTHTHIYIYTHTHIYIYTPAHSEASRSMGARDAAGDVWVGECGWVYILNIYIYIYSYLQISV